MNPSKETFYIDYHGMHLFVQPLVNDKHVHYRINFFSRAVEICMQLNNKNEIYWLEVGEGKTDFANALGEKISMQLNYRYNSNL